MLAFRHESLTDWHQVCTFPADVDLGGAPEAAAVGVWQTVRRSDMASGIIVFGLMIVVLGSFFFVAFIRAPRCSRCRIPLQPVAETTRQLGAYGVETIILYECTDCYGGL